MDYQRVFKAGLMGMASGVGFWLAAAPAQAAPPVISAIAGNGQTVFAREAATLSATVTDDATAPAELIFIWSFGDTEADFGDSAKAAARGEVIHFYDKGATGGRPYAGQLRVIDGNGESATTDFTVRVNPLRSPVTLNRDKWPFAHITRPGNGPYATDQAVRFSSGLSELGTPTAGHDTPDYEWRLYDSRRAPVGEAIIGPAFNFTFPTAGYYKLELKTNQVEVISGQVQDTYDFDNFVFEVTSNPARVGSQEFSVAIVPEPTKIDMSDDGPMSVKAKFKAIVTGGTPDFTYSWAYPPNNNEYVSWQPAPTGQRENDLSTGSSSQITFTSPGTKPIFVAVQDGAWRKVDVVYNFVITNPAYPANRTFSPAPPTAITPQPLVLSLVQADNMPLQNTVISPNLSGTVPDQTYQFRANASGGIVGGTTGYTYNWSNPVNNTRQGACVATCTYVFNRTGSYQVKVDVTDSSVPPKTVSQSLTVVIGATTGAGATSPPGGPAAPPPGGTAGPAGGTPGGGTTPGSAAPGTIVDASDTQYGLNTSFKGVSLGQSSDAKGTAAKIVNIVLGFLGIFAVIIGLWGGFQIMTAAGNEDKVASGRKALLYAVIGLVIIFAAWGIAQFVISNLLSATT